MVEHVVLFRWTHEATPEAIQRAVDELRGLKTKIPGIVELTCGASFSGRGKGFTHGLVIRFTGREAVEAYGPHPEHQRVVENFISPIRADVVVCDYDI